MRIVLPWPGSVQAYADRLPSLAEVDRRCPSCGEDALVGHGSYGRWVRSFGGRVRITVRRLRCRACRRSHSLLPSFGVERSPFDIDVHGAAADLRRSGRSRARIGTELASRGCHVPLSTLRNWSREAA